MEASDIGVNSPEFLQRKIERLKAALDEANELMDRHVTERDGARAQLDSLRRENAELRRELEEARAAAAAGPAPEAAEPAPALDPVLEQELRDRIAALEAERDALRDQPPPPAPESDDRELLARVAGLQNELAAALQAADQARSEAATARADADSARSAAAAAAAAPAGAAGTPTEGDLPAPGPFVSLDVIRDALAN